jgi:hypothetical protein
MNPHTFHQWITRKYGFFTRHRRKYPTLVHLHFPQRKISLARNLLIKHEHITIFPQLRNRVYSFNHRFYLKFDLFFPQNHYHPAIQILPFLTGVNTRFTPTNARKRPADVGARPDFMFTRTIGKIRVDSEKELYHYRDSHHSYHRQEQTGHEHEVVQLFHRFYRLQSTAFPAGPPGYFTKEEYQSARREETWKRRNEETEKRRIEGEGFPKRLEPDFLYRLMIMSKTISHVVDFGKEAFHMVRRTFLGSSRYAPRRGVEPGSLYRLMIMSKNISHVVDPGKEGFQMVRRTLIGPSRYAPRRGVDPGKEAFFSSLHYSITPLLQELSERRHSDLFFFTRNRYDLNNAAFILEKSLARMFKFPTYFFEPRRHAKGREEEKKRRNEETEKRRREGEGFPKRLEPDFIYRSLIMSKNISHVVDSGKEAFHMVRTGLFEKFLEVSEPFYKKVLTRRRHERNQLAIGSWQLARREEAGKRRREGQGFLERLEPGSIYRFMIMSKMVSHVVDPGKEAFQMARMRLLWLPTPWGPERLDTASLYQSMIMSKNISHVVDSGKEAFQMVRRTLNGPPRRGAALDYFTPHQASVGDRNQSLIDAGKPGFPAMDVKDKMIGENIFSNRGSPGISQQQMPNIDIDQLTDRVYRVLEDKIRTEKEMRGW